MLWGCSVLVSALNAVSCAQRAQGTLCRRETWPTSPGVHCFSKSVSVWFHCLAWQGLTRPEVILPSKCRKPSLGVRWPLRWCLLRLPVPAGSWSFGLGNWMGNSVGEVIQALSSLLVLSWFLWEFRSLGNGGVWKDNVCGNHTE